jgi:RDD family
MEKQNRVKAMFWRRAFSALIDIVFIYCIGYLVQQSIIQFVWIDLFTVFAITWILYYSVCYSLLKGRTLVKVITGLQVITNTNKEIGVRYILIREVVCKFFILLLIPYYLVIHTHIYKSSQFQIAIQIALISIVVLIIITLGLFFIFKKAWWELVSSTKTIKFPVAHRSLRFVSFMAIVIIYAMTVFMKINPFFNDSKNFKTTFYPEYPVNAESRKYADYIKTHSQNPVDYVFSLFDKYDLVVLSERLHPEYTQYELISKIISDNRFSDKIGNIYTECGSISFQDTLNTYLNTVFPCEDSLNMATALLQRNSDALWPLWGNTNLFDLLKHVNKLNSYSVDSLKINWYFTDIPVNWETMTPLNYLKLSRWEKRDKIMADHIIDIYRNKLEKNEKRKKGLVIMNWRHGYGLIRDMNGKKTSHYFNKTNTTAFLQDSLPNKVCNILINTVRFGPSGFGVFFPPIQNGKWDRAFTVVGIPDVGFNFENSPFGYDNFDAYIGNPSDELKYKDVFTGFIFYKPLEQHINKTGFPYMLYNFEDSLIRRAKCVSTSFAESEKNLITMYKNDKIYTEAVPYALFYNLIVNIGFSVIIFLTLIICWIFYLTKIK